MKKDTIEKKYEVYKRHFEKAKKNPNLYFDSGRSVVYRKLNKAQFEEIYNEFYKGNKNYARQIIYDFNKSAAYSDAQADIAAQTLYRLTLDDVPEKLANVLNSYDQKKVEDYILYNKDGSVNLEKLKNAIMKGKCYNQLKKYYDEKENNPGIADEGTIEYNYIYGSP